MNNLEKLRIEISINIAKRDLKKRWEGISPESRSAIREEFGEWMNKSSFEEEDIIFLDFFNDL
tara:strand:- start:284 stop:472 length:189 start_codon:yes stop_codon:yes gene_type:complete